MPEYRLDAVRAELGVDDRLPPAQRVKVANDHIKTAREHEMAHDYESALDNYTLARAFVENPDRLDVKIRQLEVKAAAASSSKRPTPFSNANGRLRYGIDSDDENWRSRASLESDAITLRRGGCVQGGVWAPQDGGH